MKISVIGDGGWGTAIALLLDTCGHQVTLWGSFPEYIAQMQTLRANPRFLPGIDLSPTLKLSADIKAATTTAEVIILASPSKFFTAICQRLKGLVAPGTLVVSLTKGLCEDSHQRMSQLAQNILGIDQVVVLSGPSHAEEVARQIPTAVVAAAADLKDAQKVQKIFAAPHFRVYTSNDVIGVEIGGAIKNIIAIAVGASDGLGFGDNTRAALITRGLAEITRFGTALGARAETFAGLSGIGDLIVTCTSSHSRNYTVGKRLGQGETIKSILDSMQMVAEGVWNAHVIHQLNKGQKIEMPICQTVYDLCYGNLTATEAVKHLMQRELKQED